MQGHACTHRDYLAHAIITHAHNTTQRRGNTHRQDAHEARPSVSACTVRRTDGRTWTTHLQSDVEVQEADGALVPQLILFLHTAHLHDTERLGLGRQSLHTEGLQAVLWGREGEERIRGGVVG